MVPNTQATPVTPESAQQIIQPDLSQKPPLLSKRKIILLSLICFFVFLALLIVAYIFYSKPTSNEASSTPSTSAQNTTSTPVVSSFNPANGIAFLRKGDIWTANYDGSNQQQVTKLGNITSYYWLSSDKKLIFETTSRQNNATLSQLFFYNLSNRQTAILFEKPWPDSGEISADFTVTYNVSPDGKYLFLSGDCCTDGGILIEIITSKQQKFFSNDVYRVLLSPDSKSLFVATDEPGKVLTWEWLSLNDFTVKKFPSKGSLVDWTNDGKNIVYLANSHENADSSQPQHLFYLLHLPDMQTKTLTTENPDDGFYFYLGQSPDGKQFDFLIDNRYARVVDGQPIRRGPSYLSRINLETSQRTDYHNFLEQNSENAPYLSQWLYTPDGKSILYNFYNQSAPIYENDEIHQIDASLSQSTDRLLINNAKSPQWVY